MNQYKILLLSMKYWSFCQRFGYPWNRNRDKEKENLLSWKGTPKNFKKVERRKCHSSQSKVCLCCSNSTLYAFGKRKTLSCCLNSTLYPFGKRKALLCCFNSTLYAFGKRKTLLYCFNSTLYAFGKRKVDRKSFELLT